MEQEGFTYYAFISYSHKNQEIAKELKQFLEKYNLPSNLQKSHPSLPKKFSPIFIDELNLAGPGPLQKNLCENLEASKYLIVICSPNSAQSWYVNNEVNYFINTLHRVDRIIPLIVDGTPHSEDPDTECFPPAILALGRELEPLGIDMKMFKKRGAFLRVIAALLNLKPGKFIPWIERERMKKIALISSLAVSFLIAAGLFVWHTFIPHHRYYHTYAYKWGKPVGLFEVKSELDRMKTDYTYRFTTLRGKVQMIERVNSAGTLTDPQIVTPLNELPMIRFVSDRETEYYDLYRRKVYRKVYTDENMQIADFYSGGEGGVTYSLPSDMYDYYNSGKYNLLNDIQESGSIIRKTMEYDRSGYVIREMFRRDNIGGRDRKGTPAQDKKGRWGFSYVRDNLGRVTEVRYLDKNGNAMSVQGVSAEYTDYGDTPYPVKATFVDENGNPVLGPYGVAFDIVSYDKYFKPVKWSCYGTEGERVLHTNHNVSEVVHTYDEDSGFLTSSSYYDTELAPCLCKDGYFRESYVFDSKGRAAECYYYDVRGERTTCSNGYSGCYAEYCDDGQLSKQTYVDAENKPTIDSYYNVYGYKYSYEDGLLTRTDFLDSEGNLMLNKYGYASVTFTYNKDDNTKAGVIYLDTEGKRTLSSFGYAEWRDSYIERTQSSQIYSSTYYDENGRPTSDESGVAEYINEYRDGNLMSKKFLDTEGRLTFSTQGYARVDYEYDSSGLKIWERYYGDEGKRVNIPDGYSAVRYEYDSRGVKNRQTYYDAEDHYAIQADEYYCYAKEYDYDSRGNIVHIRYIKLDDSRYQDMLDRQVKDIYYEYDKHGNETKLYRINSRGEAVDANGNTGGSVRIEREYDIRGKISRHLEYKNGEKEAWIVQEYKRDSLGRTISTSAVRYIDGRGDGLTRKWEYDAYGRRCKESWLDRENKLFIPCKTKEFRDLNLDYAVKKMSHDIFGNETDVWYYDAEGEPLFMQDFADVLFMQKSSHKKAFHTVRTYNSSGKILTESYYNDEKTLQPLKISDGFHKIECKYDALGHETERLLYDPIGKLLQREVKSYNSFGQIASIETYDSEGKPLYVNGFFRVKYAYDSYGNKSDIWYFDADGKPCRRHYRGKAREHHLKRTYYARNKILSQELFDTEEKPDSSHGGIHKVVYVYNSYGWRIEENEYDSEQRVLNKVLISYDSAGKETKRETKRFGSQKK